MCTVAAAISCASTFRSIRKSTRDLVRASNAQKNTPRTGLKSTMKIVSGSVYWLPKLSKPTQKHSFWGHPIIVMNSSGETAQVCYMTSFGNRDIDDKYRRLPHLRSAYLAVGNTPAFDTRRVIQTTDNMVFKEHQYIRLESVKVPVKLIQPFRPSKRNHHVCVTEDTWSYLVYCYMRQNHPKLTSSPAYKEMAAQVSVKKHYTADDGWSTLTRRSKTETAARALRLMGLVGGRREDEQR